MKRHPLPDPDAKPLEQCFGAGEITDPAATRTALERLATLIDTVLTRQAAA